MRLDINGVIISKDDYSSKNTTVDISEVEADGFRKAVVQTEYSLKGAAFDLVNAELIEDPNGKNKSIPVKIWEDTCCDEDILLFEGIIRGDGVDWCYGECSCTVSFFEQTESTLKIDCIQSTLIDDNWNNFQTQNHPRLKYCVELRPELVAHLILIFGVIFNLIFSLLYIVVAVIFVIVSVINAIIFVVNQIPGVDIDTIDFDGNDSTNVLQEYSNLIDQINERLVGCGRVHPSPFVRSYIQNVCQKCGLTFSSTIFGSSTSQYYNTMYMNAPIEKGTRDDDVKYIFENRPLLTLDGLLKQLQIPFNADYDVIDGVLYFERKDFFWQGGTYVSYLSLDGVGRIENKLCLSWRDEERPSYARFAYSLDAMDVCGNEAQFRYNDIVEWNQPYSNLQSGKREVFLPFGTPRFRDDGIDPDILDSYSSSNNGIGGTINAHNGVLILANHLAFQPKLLIWDGVDLNFARVKKYDIPNFDVPASENYNYPYLFNEFNSSPNTAYPTNHPNSGLYPRFWSIDNPKLIQDQGKEFEFSFYYNCETLQGAKTARFVQLPMGVGRIKKVSVNLDSKSITIQGDV